MFRKTFWFGGVMLLTGAVALATPDVSWAQRGGHAGGGGHFGGGGHAIGGHAAGGHFGSFGGGFYRGGYQGGYRYRNSYGHYGYYPYYSGYGFYPNYYAGYPYIGSDPAYEPGDSGFSADAAPDSTGSVSQSLYPPAQPDAVAHVTVTLPADAHVWFQNTPMTTTGPVRQFDSPPLEPGRSYTYDVRAAWTENGHEVTQDQQVEVTAAGHVNVTFPAPSKVAGPATTAKTG